MISCVIVFLALLVAVIQTKPHYNMFVVEMDWNITTPHNFEMEWHTSRISRGVEAMSGVMNVKENINTDNCIFLFNVRYSKTGVSYALSPFRYPANVFTDAISTAYKDYLMDTLVECCENAVYIEDKFVQPLTKRRMECVNCMLNIDNYPSHLRMGYYEVSIVIKGELSVVTKILMKAETE